MSRLRRAMALFLGVLAATQIASSPALAQTDPLLEFQWHLKSPPAEPAGANVQAAWPTTTGEGIVVGISDSALDYTHPDLAPNYVPSLSFDFVDPDNDPYPECPTSPCYEESHATAVAGIAAARGDNGIGVSGVAPRAGIAGLRIRLDNGYNSEVTQALAMAHELQAIQVMNMSWGPNPFQLMPSVERAIEQGITEGRGGKGRIYVNAAGNHGEREDNCNFDSLANSRYIIAVGAMADDGQHASYSESCSALFVSAPGGLDGGRWLVTTDLFGVYGYTPDSEYTNMFGQTSGAAPVVSGVVALMLARNLSLTWRDVKEILVRSAVLINPDDPGWSSSPFPHNERYGFGLIDAQKAVALAASWTNVAAESAIIPEMPGNVYLPVVIPDAPDPGLFDTITIGSQFSNFRVEHVEVVFDADHEFPRHIEVTLTSPSGVVSRLAPAGPALQGSLPAFQNWRFGSVRHWGEPAAGTWTLRVADRVPGNVGTWSSWQLRIFGTSAPISPVLTVAPSGIDFGSVTVGGTAQRSLTITNTGNATLTGSASAAAPFSIVSGGSFSLTGNQSQQVVVRFSPTAPGSFAGSVNFTSNGGTVSRAVTGTGTTDSTPPTVTITSPTANSTHSTSNSALTLGGTVSDNVGVTQVTWANSRGGSGTASGTTSWTASGIVLQPGSNVLTVTARDAAGNTGTDTLTVTLTDSTPPTVTITSPTANSTYSTSSSPLTLGGTASDNVGVTQVTWTNSRGGSGTASGTTSWTATGIVLQLGSNVLTVSARDAAGNTTTDSLTVTLLNATPTLAVTPTTVHAGGTVTVTVSNGPGNPRDWVGLYRQGDTAYLDYRYLSGSKTPPDPGRTTASFPFPLPAQPGTYEFRFFTNLQRLATSPVVTVVSPLTVTITSPTANSTYSTSNSSLTLGGTVSDNVGVIQVTWANNRGGSGTATGTTSWTASGIVLQLGSNVLTVTARDATGNTATDTLTVTRTDTTPPGVTITSPTTNSTYTTSNSSQTLGGTASDNIGVTQVTWANSRGGSGTASGTTSWTATGIVLQLGSNVLTVMVRDAAGNTATDTLTVTLTDSALPTVAIASPTANSTYTTSNSSLTLGGTASDNVGVTQVTWANNRGGSGTASGTASWTVAGIVLQPGSNVLTVTARDAAGNTATDTLTATLSVTFTFTDDPLTTQSTLIKTVHIVELRTAVDNSRRARGLATFAWTDPTLTPGSTTLKAVHLTELRTALNQAYQAVGLISPSYTDPTVVAGLTISKSALHQNL